MQSAKTASGMSLGQSGWALKGLSCRSSIGQGEPIVSAQWGPLTGRRKTYSPSPPNSSQIHPHLPTPLNFKSFILFTLNEPLSSLCCPKLVGIGLCTRIWSNYQELKTISSSLDAHLWSIAPPLAVGPGDTSHIHAGVLAGWILHRQPQMLRVHDCNFLPCPENTASLLPSIASGSCCPNRKKADTLGLSQLYLDAQVPQGRRRGLTSTGHPLTSTGTLCSTCAHTQIKIKNNKTRAQALGLNPLQSIATVG